MTRAPWTVISNADNATNFYVLAVPRPDQDNYRGLGRWDLGYMRSIEISSDIGSPSDVQFEWEVPERYDGSRDSIPTGRGILNAVRRYLAGVEWAKISVERWGPYMPAEWELAAAARVFSDDDVRLLGPAVARACINDLGEEPDDLRFYGVDILEWRSAWSVMENHESWAKEPPELNEHGLAPTYEEAIRIWERYLRSDDPDFGSVDIYRFMAVFGCKRLWPLPEAGPRPAG